MSNNNKNDQLEENFQVNQNDYAVYNELLEKIGNIKKGTIMSGVVRDFDTNYVFIDLGLKADGKIPKDEFYVEGNTKLPEKGEAINVLLESLEDVNGNLVVSYSKALRQEKWEQLEQYFQKRTTIEGTVVRKVNGGCIVNVLGIGVFLPKTHFIKDVKDSREMIGKKVSCTIIKMDYAKRNIVVSAKNSNDMEILSTFSEKQIVPGVVKNISESYALIELTSGVLGKLNAKDISWNRVENINDFLTLGQTIQVKIMNIFESSRIELSMKDIEENPWIKTLKEHNLEKNMEVEGVVTRISDKFMNLKIKDAITGSVHISETAWMKKFQNFDDFKVNKVVKAKIININSLNSDLVLSIKELEQNSIHQFKIGEQLKGKILGNSELGYIVNIHDKIHGIIPNSSYYLDGSLQEGKDVDVYVHSTKNQQLILGTKAPVQ